MKNKEYWINWAKAAGRFGSPGTAVNRNMLSRGKRRPGAHDMYKSGEYMIWTDGNTYKCISDTNFSPVEYAQAWEIYNA